MQIPDLSTMLETRAEPMRPVLEQFSADHDVLARRHPIAFAPAAIAARRAFGSAWSEGLRTIDYDALDASARVDCHLLRRRIAAGLDDADREERQGAEVAALLPFAPAILALHEARQRLDLVEARAAAEALDGVAREASALHDRLKAAKAGSAADRPPPVLAHRAARRLDALKSAVEDWQKHYAGFDPQIAWWTATPCEKALKALGTYAQTLRRDCAGEPEDPDAEQPVVGDPLGRDAIVRELARELIPYSPEELIGVAGRERAWCENELRAAARALGFGDDWRRALEHVKRRHAEPGRQPQLVRELADEAVAFLERHDLVTVPPLAHDVWRMQMITPEQQKTSPFFWGGETMGVSFPHAAMAHSEKLMSMRGNNAHFARATVHHELIPGHHLQEFVALRRRLHRRGYGSVFYIEGWALYWEMLLWDLGFPQSAEDRIGMLFWRLHRCARVEFSLRFHLGTLTAEECIALLVDGVGHERSNAVAEVRRSFAGDYSPLYQCAYLIGGLQLMALRRELVDAGRMGNRAFHDAVLAANNIPFELLRAELLNERLARDHAAQWRFV